jgi:hypothetical protein
MDRTRHRQQTKLDCDTTGTTLPIHRTLCCSRSSDSYHNKSHSNHTIGHHIHKYLLAIAVGLGNIAPVSATDVGGVSATANPVANSSGSVTNQAIQVLQGPYITNTYGGGVQCQGPTANFTPYVTRTGNWSDPYEPWWNDPVYNNADNNDDGIPDSPGEILYYIPTRTGQKATQNISLGFSATLSIPLDKELQKQCKEAAAANIAAVNQATANKRLDFEIARLKNCGELMKAGIMFAPNSPYHKVCADVVLVNPPGVVGQHVHQIKPTGDASSLKEVSIGNEN